MAGINDGSLRKVTIGFDQGNDVRIKSPGIYFARLSVDGRTALTRKVTMVR